MKGRAYRALSPVIEHRPDGQVLALRRASLVNRPNLRGLATLHATTSETTMTLLARLAAALQLAVTTTEDQLVEAVTSLNAAQAGTRTALQAALDPIATAVGLAAGADAAAVLAGVQTLKAGGGDAAVTALQAELVAVTTQLNALVETGKRTAAETFVDDAIKAGRVGVKPIRDRYVTLHMADPAGAVALIAALPILGGGGQIVPSTPPAADGEIALNAEQASAARLLGLDPKAYAETLKAERQVAL